MKTPVLIENLIGKHMAKPRTFACKGRLAKQMVSLLIMLIMLCSLRVRPADYRPADYVIVVDVSGSMMQPVSSSDKRVRIAVVQEELRRYLPALPNRSRVQLIAFSSGILSEKEITLAHSDDLNVALAWVNNLQNEARKNGKTYLWTTLRHALRIASEYSKARPDQPVTVRVLTDGDDNEQVTTLDKVLEEFRSVLDGEHIRGNLVLLGDLELRTRVSKLALPEGAFDVTSNPAWQDIFPPVVLWSPAEPVVGEQVRVFENTKSIYKEYQWFVDGLLVDSQKVLTWYFTEARTYKVTLRVRGLQGTRNSTTVFIRPKEKAKIAADFVMFPPAAAPGQELKFLARCGAHAVRFAWYVDSDLASTNQDLTLLRRFRWNWQRGKCKWHGTSIKII